MVLVRRLLNHKGWKIPKESGKQIRRSKEIGNKKLKNM